MGEALQFSVHYHQALQREGEWEEMLVEFTFEVDNGLMKIKNKTIKLFWYHSLCI